MDIEDEYNAEMEGQAQAVTPTLWVPTCGLHFGVPDEGYHGDRRAVTRSKLWKAWDRTPAHARYQEQEDKPEFALGHMVHTAILEPHKLETKYVRGPVDRRGNKWKDAVLYANSLGAECLVEADYDKALVIRDVAMKNHLLRQLLSVSSGEPPRIESTAVYADEELGTLCKVRADIWSPAMGLISDLKTTTNAGMDWRRSFFKFGYHVQEPMYTDGYQQAGADVDGFVFIVMEKDIPWLTASYESNKSTYREGYAVYRNALRIWTEHAKREKADPAYVWPGYSADVQGVGLRKYEYTQTTPDEKDILL